MNEEKFRASINTKADEELIEIIVNKSEYREEVALIAETELKNRNIDEQIFQKKCAEISQRVRTEQKQIEDLSGKEKVVVFFGIFIFIIRFLGFNKFPLVPKAIDYVNAGFDRKAEKIVIYKTISIIFWAFFVLIAYISSDFYLAEQRRIEHETKNQLTKHCTRNFASSGFCNLICFSNAHRLYGPQPAQAKSCELTVLPLKGMYF